MRLGPYEVLAQLGQGSAGVVYRAIDRRLEREVALKVFRGTPRDPDALRRFVLEARAIARLHHPNVVALHDACILEGKRVLVLELVTGCLRDRLAKEPLAPREAAALVRDVARGVHAAHRAGILHRDLKPGNVLLEPDGRPRLTDFGLAIATHSLESSSGESGFMNGTPAYMAPEQVAGAVEAFGPWTDVWGLGCLLHACLTGAPPFGQGFGLRTLRRIREEDPAPLPGVPAALVAVRDRALAKARSARFASAEEMAAALDAFVAGGPAVVTPLPAAPRFAGGGEERRERLMRIAATLTCACLLLLIFATLRR